jgi:hypothetical protein
LLIVVVALSALHMFAPDHWIPVTVASYRRNFTRTRTYLLASGIGLSHGVSSAALSVAIAEVGSFFFPTYYVNLFAVTLLVVIAIYIFVGAARKAKSGGKAESVSVLVSVIPDPALVPFVLIARGFGATYSWLMVIAFVVAAVVSVTLVVFLATKGLSVALSSMKAEHVDYVVAGALMLVAAFIYLYG